MRALPAVAASRCGVVTLAELLAAGWTHEAIRHAVRTGGLERVAAGRFAPPPPAHINRFRQADLRLLRQAIAATLSHRVAVSHLAAALLRRWPVWANDPHACVGTWDPRVRRVTGAHVHRLRDDAPLMQRQGILVTPAARTVLDIAREFGTEAGLVTGDVALREGAITRASLVAEVERAAGLSGVGAARRLADLLDPLAESPLESRSRWHFDVHDIVQPCSQVELSTLEGAFLGRVDHFWPEGVVGEADGASKYRDPDDPDALAREKRRQQKLEDVDLEVVRWGARDLVDFTAAAGRIERARARARRRLAEGDLLWHAVYQDAARVQVSGVRGR